MIIVLILLDLRVILNNNSGVKYNFVDRVIIVQKENVSVLSKRLCVYRFLQIFFIFLSLKQQHIVC